VCFSSDNGGPNLSAKSGSNFTDNSPLRGAKGMVYDGGIRVPFLLSWPSKIKAGSVYDQPVITLDFYATALAIGGGEVPTDRQIDSVNLLPHLTGEQAGAPHAALFWRSNGPGGNLAIRAGDWKMVRLGKTPDQLYNLASDIGEAHDLAAEKPDVLVRLQSELNAWDQQLIKPVFPGAAAKKQAAKGKAKGNAKTKAKQE
jgi:arylsulfatase A-like enzyme